MIERTKGQGRGRHWDILLFSFLVVESEEIPCVLARQRKGRKNLDKDLKKEIRTRGRKEEKKSQMGKCQGVKNFPERYMNVYIEVTSTLYPS